jgi:L-alanine-DL-glutamate epimerase-like enolase superfamily enzyme
VEALCYPVAALEEPLRPGDIKGMRRVASRLGTRIIVDESMLRAAQLSLFAEDPDRWILNVRVSKMGGLVRALSFVDEARRRGLKVIVGAHVGETSVLTRAALTVAHSGRDVLVAQEGAFGTHLLARDVVDPPIMFGAGGFLDIAEQAFAGQPGHGLVVHDPIPVI